MCVTDFSKVSYAIETAMSISGMWLLVGPVRKPHTLEASSLLLSVRISVTSQSQIATITSIYFCCK